MIYINCVQYGENNKGDDSQMEITQGQDCNS